MVQGGMNAMNKKTVLFICRHNSARSQMAEGLLRALHGDRFEAFSAGTEPTAVHPMAVWVMAELGIDISGQRSKSVEEFRDQKLDYIVTVCDRAHQDCPFFPGGMVQLHRGFWDPARPGRDEAVMLEDFRRTRDELREWILEAFAGEGPALPNKDTGWELRL
jgi:arsenate reductase